MRGVTHFIVTTCAIAAGVIAVPQRKHHHGAGASASGAAVGAVAGTTAALPASSAAASPVATASATPAGTVTRGAQTVVLFEVGGVPGNECLTFRNNGEIVDAACVDTSADRQLTPSTIGTQAVLLVQRSFDASFRPDLVGIDACVGFNGTDFKAEPCDAAGVTPVVFVGGELQAGTACASGHDAVAQLTVDTAGKTCAQYTVTDVAAAAP